MNEVQDTSKLLQDLLRRVEALERQAPKDQLTIGIMSGELDRVMLAFIIALGATTFDMEVDLVFSLQATAALRDPKKSHKDLHELEPHAIHFDLKAHGAMTLEQLMELAGEAGVRITVCNLGLDLMEIGHEELIDYPNLTYAGVATFIEMCSQSRQCWFM
jgi:peroxiredoxin family protein